MHNTSFERKNEHQSRNNHPPAKSPRLRPRWPWLTLLALVAMGTIFLTASLLMQQSQGPSQKGAIAATPTSSGNISSTATSSGNISTTPTIPVHPPTPLPGSDDAIFNGQVVHTDDTGATWKNETLPTVSNAYVADTFMLDAKTQWVLFNGTDGTATVARTIDGGAHWQLTKIPPQTPGVDNPSTLQFVNGTTGWLTVDTSRSANSSSAILYHSTDGGATWQSTNLPAGGIPLFISATTGWFTGSTAYNVPMKVYRTLDGGNSWQQQMFAAPTGTNGNTPDFSEPIFFDSQHGVMLAEYFTVLQIYVTKDGGMTWSAGSQFSIQDTSLLRAVQTHFGQSAWVDFGAVFYVTHDAGATWQQGNLPQGGGVSSMHFLSSTAGWAETGNGVCPNKQNCTYTSTLWYTVDAGKTWFQSQSVTGTAPA